MKNPHHEMTAISWRLNGEPSPESSPIDNNAVILGDRMTAITNAYHRDVRNHCSSNDDQ